MSRPVLRAEVQIAAGILAADGAPTTDLTADSAIACATWSRAEPSADP